RAARQTRATDTFTGRGMTALMRSPAWRWSFVGLAFGYGCYLAALGRAPLALVQPIMISGLVLGSLFAARLAGRRLDPTVASGSVLCLLGLVALVTLARPAAGVYDPVPAHALAGVGGMVALLLVAALLLGTRSPAQGFALAAGGLFGVTATLTKIVLAQVGVGWAEPLGSWPLYGALVAAPLGFLCSQRAFQLSPLLAPVNSLISATDTVVAPLIGVLVLGERTVTTPVALAGQALALATVLYGIWTVTRRAGRLTAAVRQRAGAARADSSMGWG